MDFVTVQIENKYNKYSEPVQSLVIRETNTTRMLLCPTLSIDELGNGNVSGSIIFEKKGLNEMWERDKTFQLSRLSSGEWTKIDLRKEEISLLIDYSKTLKDITTKDGLPTWINQYVLIRKGPFDNIDEPTIARIKKFIMDHIDDVEVFDEFDKYWGLIQKLYIRKETKSIDLLLEKIAESKLSNDDLARLTSALDSEMLSFVDYSLNIRKLQKAINFLESNLEISDEHLFQVFFENNPFVLQMIFPSLVHYLNGVRYMGGKNANNQKGIITDLVFSNKINNVSIVELKTPKTDLISSSKYRDNYEIHKSLMGSIVQAKKQKSTLMRNFNHIKDGTELGEYSTLIDPNIILLIGNKSSLNPSQIESLDYFRASLKDIIIITYDELINRFKLILNNLK